MYHSKTLPRPVLHTPSPFQQVISEELGLSLENITEEHLGTCAKIKVTNDDNIIILDAPYQHTLDEPL